MGEVTHTPAPAGPFRVGRKQPRNIYQGDEFYR